MEGGSAYEYAGLDGALDSGSVVKSEITGVPQLDVKALNDLSGYSPCAKVYHKRKTC